MCGSPQFDTNHWARELKMTVKDLVVKKAGQIFFCKILSERKYVLFLAQIQNSCDKMEIDVFLGFLAFLTVFTMGFWMLIFLLTFVVPYWLFGNLMENWKLKKAEKKAKSK